MIDVVPKFRELLSKFCVWLNSGEPPKQDYYRVEDEWEKQPPAYREDGLATGGGAGNVGGFGDVS